jgi:hypothetical protein
MPNSLDTSSQNELRARANDLATDLDRFNVTGRPEAGANALKSLRLLQENVIALTPDLIGATVRAELLHRLESRFPWIGTDEEADGGDAVDTLNEIYQELKGGK